MFLLFGLKARPQSQQQQQEEKQQQKHHHQHLQRSRSREKEQQQLQQPKKQSHIIESSTNRTKSQIYNSATTATNPATPTSSSLKGPQITTAKLLSQQHQHYQPEQHQTTFALQATATTSTIHGHGGAASLSSIQDHGTPASATAAVTSSSSASTSPPSSSSSPPTGNLTVTPRCLHLHLHLIIVIILACCTRRLHCLPDGRATCRSVPGLTKDQLELCYKASDVTTAALEGLDLAIRECQTQFQWHRWNCSSLNTKSRNPHASNLLKKGYRESAFAFAISAAGVAHSVARACSQGRLMSCGCDPSVNRKTLNKNLRQSLDKEKKLFLQYLETNQILNPEDEKKYERSKIASRWKWGGCSHNMDFGVEFSKLFLDCREKAGDIQSKINLHNNHAGRIAVSNNMEFRCKCHGMSGSCQLKTCWKSAPDFHVVGKVLKHQFRRALLVDQSNLGNGEPIVVLKRSRNKKSNNANGNGERTGERHERPSNAKSNTEKNAQRSARKLETSLFYYQRSPNFCEKDPSADILGTVGRKCNRNSTLSDGCTSLCCGRGYSLVKERRAERCHCKFQWCCNVECDECHVEEWISVCN
ncbi:protein Wnt-10b [Musca domestica]|uniref:Protein Wnt n=1 Tax=Musca domestica TaxID=7370 RepID=A0ABM3UV02_MUSDO|nr:protein Wnt-10b [Musca domestica]